MKRKLHLTISTPCHERWDTMDATEHGAFCHSCRKEVVDFSAMTDAQVIQWLDKNSTGCGRFRKDQLERDMSLPIVHDSPLRRKVLLMGLLPVFSLTPLSTRAALHAPMDQAPQKSKVDTATAKIDTTTSACDTILTGVCGRVLDENGEALIGATVQVIDNNGKQTGQGASADLDGNFTLALHQESTVNLRVSFIGYKRHILTGVKVGHPYITFKMKPAQNYTGEVEIKVMYGTFVRHLTPAQKIKRWFRRGFYTLTHLREHRQYKLAQRRMKD